MKKKIIEESIAVCNSKRGRGNKYNLGKFHQESFIAIGQFRAIGRKKAAGARHYHSNKQSLLCH